MYGWAGPIQERVLAQLLPLAQNVAPATEVTIDLQHKTLRVVVSSPVDRTIKEAVRSAILTTPVGAFLTQHGWSLVTEEPRPRPYTSHVRWSQVARPHPRLGGNVCVLVLSQLEVEALRDAFRLLQRRASNARVVATFGMGGVPLLQWLSAPSSGAAVAIASALAQAPRYHLHAGLNWSGTQREKDAFKAWVARELATAGQVFVFDTGREGNGIRQAASLAREATSTSTPVAGASIVVAGLIDGRPRKPEHHAVLGANGVSVDVTVDYTRVPHLPTEDNGLLIGYEADRAAGVLHPVSGLILHRIESQPAFASLAARVTSHLDGRLPGISALAVQFSRRFTRHARVASTSGANTMSALVLDGAVSKGSHLHQEEHEWGTAAILLSHAQRTELEALENAIAAGLIAPPILNSVVRRHGQEQAELLTFRWDRDPKRVIVLKT